MNKELLKMNLQLLAEDTEGEPEDTVDSTSNNEEGTEEERAETAVKSFTQAEVDKMIQDRLARESKKLAKEQQAKIEEAVKESERLAKLTEDERQKELVKQKEQTLLEREKELQAKEQELERITLLNLSKDRLDEKSLPISFADMLTSNAKDADEINENIKNFEVEFKKAVEVGVNERLKGSSPLSSTKGGVKKFDLSNMTEKEINDNWDEIQKQF